MTTAHAEQLGWTASAQRHAIARGDLVRLGRGVIEAVTAPDPAQPQRQQAEASNLRRARTAALRCCRAAITHRSAAIAHVMPTIGDLERACVTVQSGTAMRELADVHLHRATLLDTEIVLLDGYRVTAPARTVLDVAREQGVAAGVVAADYALHEALLDEESLAAAFELCAGWPGRRAAGTTLALADRRSESPLESLSRLRIMTAGLPKPWLQARILDRYGRFVGRSDFYWDQFGVIGEADGDLKYERGREAIVAERRRQQNFEDLGLIVVRWGWADLSVFDAVARRLRAGFARGVRPGGAERSWVVGALHPQPSLARRISGR